MEPDGLAIAGRPAGISAALLRRAVGAVLRGERRRAIISITFLGPAAMRRMNRRHLGHDRSTDVLAFGLRAGSVLLGDVYLCRAVAAAEARRRKIPLREEVARLVIHGVLHVLGHDHPDTDRERSPMWRKQERYLARALPRPAGARA